MAEEEKQQGGEKPEEQSQQKAEGEKPIEFEAWLKDQPDGVRAAYETHVGGLKSALEKERKTAKKRDDEAAEAERKRQEAALSESEKAAKRLAELEKTNVDLAERWKGAQAREALRTTAGKLAIAFANAQAEADAIGFALGAAKIGEDGTVEDAETVLKTVIKDRPYLVRTEGGEGRGTPRPDPNAKTKAGQMSDEEKKRLAERYGVKTEFVK